jgi:hypothetical protein
MYLFIYFEGEQSFQRMVTRTSKKVRKDVGLPFLSESPEGVVKVPEILFIHINARIIIGIWTLQAPLNKFCSVSGRSSGASLCGSNKLHTTSLLIRPKSDL